MRTPNVKGAAVALAIAVLMSGCAATSQSDFPTDHPTSLPSPAYQGSFTNAAPCHDQKKAMCATLTVPLDYANPTAAKLDLPVRWSTRAPVDAPTLLLLDGGPGYGENEPLLYSDIDQLPNVAMEYRFAVIEQRGTAKTALNCPALQREPTAVGADVLPVPPALITGCGESIGPSRQFYSTEATVSDLDAYRRALGIDSWSIMGLSYGTFVAQRYAISHPKNVGKVVLDSVVPQDGGDAYYSSSMHESGRVLAEVCAAHSCHFDPAADITKVLAMGTDSVALFNALLGATSRKPKLYPIITAVHAAANGNRKPLTKLLAASVSRTNLPTADEFSVALYYATTCTDLHFPWGNSEAPVAGRHALTEAGAKQLNPAALLPFNQSTAANQGIVVNCEPWPITPAADYSGGTFPDVPTLLINGGWDLITPAADARAQGARIPKSKLVIIPRWGHQAVDTGPGAAVISNFLLATSTR